MEKKDHRELRSTHENTKLHLPNTFLQACIENAVILYYSASEGINKSKYWFTIIPYNEDPADGFKSR